MHREDGRDDAAHDLIVGRQAVAAGHGVCSSPSKQVVSTVHVLWRGHLGRGKMMQIGRECSVHGSAEDDPVVDVETCSKSKELMLNHAEAGRSRAL